MDEYEGDFASWKGVLTQLENSTVKERIENILKNPRKNKSFEVFFIVVCIYHACSYGNKLNGVNIWKKHVEDLKKQYPNFDKDITKKYNAKYDTIFKNMLTKNFRTCSINSNIPKLNNTYLMPIDFSNLIKFIESNKFFDFIKIQ